MLCFKVLWVRSKIHILSDIIENGRVRNSEKSVLCTSKKNTFSELSDLQQLKNINSRLAAKYQ